MDVVDLTESQADPIRSAIENHPEKPPGAKLRKLIILSEWADDEGSWIGGFSDCTPWEGEGILRWALRQGLHFAGDYDDDDEDGD